MFTQTQESLRVFYESSEEIYAADRTNGQLRGLVGYYILSEGGARSAVSNRRHVGAYQGNRKSVLRVL